MSERGADGGAALRFVLAMGVVNLFADLTYEGGGSINGPFMGSLGASAAAVGIVAGVGEFLGYALRVVAGAIADRTGRVWLLTFVGYAVNLLSVPAVALVGGWPGAAALVLAERTGRAIRKPTVEAMLSYATGRVGTGWAYALNTALDETGATVGPLVVALVMFQGGGYRAAYATLLASAALALVALTVARWAFPAPERLEERRDRPRELGRPFWLTMAAGACLAAGLMSFELVSYHLATAPVVAARWIPVYLAISTGIGVFASLAFGRLYDRIGLGVVVVAVLLSSGFAPLVFFGGPELALAGLVLWGVGYATQDTLLKAIVAGLLPEGRRNVAFGLFYTGYGGGWLVGSVTTGLLYARSIPAMVAFSVVAQLASLPLFLLAGRAIRR